MTAITSAARQSFVGASEAAALPTIGVSPYMTPFELWHLKAGNIDSIDLDHVERIQAGQFLEPAIAEWAKSKFDWNLGPVNDEYRLHPTVTRMGASWDFEEIPDNGPRGPVEIKNVDGRIFRDEWEADGDVILQAPLHILIQVQHQLAVRPEADHGWILACVGGNELKRMRVPRHEGTINRIETAMVDFWASIEARIPPNPNWVADAKTIASLYSAAGEDIVNMTGNDKLTELIVAHAGLTAQIKTLNAEKKAIRSQVLPMIGDAKKVEGDGFSIAAGTVNKRESFVKACSYRNFRVHIKKEK